MASVVVAGVAVVDFVFNIDEMPAHPEKYRARDATIVGGGCAANAAVAVARLGGEATLLARLGDDQIADIILSDLQAENVNTGFVDQAAGGRSSFSSIYVDGSGERQIMNFRGSGLNQRTEWLDDAPRADAILADNRWPQGAAKMMAIARQRAIPGIIDGEDPIDLETLKDASHVAFSRQGLVALTGEDDLAVALKAAGTELSCWLCVTDGPQGVYFLNDFKVGSKVEHVPGFDVDVKDTLGAGDVWHGAFALCLAEGVNELDAIDFANAAAAIKCTKNGGRAGCPDRIATTNFLKEKR